MNLKDFNKKDIIFSLDIGTRSIIGTVGVIKDKKFQVVCEKYLEHEERAMVDGQIHDINLVASVVEKVKSQIEKEIDIELEEVTIAAAGRFLRTIDAKSEIELNGDEEIDKEIVRSLELSAVKNAEDEIKSNTQGKLYCVGYSVKNFYLNSFLISNLIGHKGEKIECEIIATFLPRSVIESLYSVMNKVNLKVTNLTLEPIAAIEAAVPKKLRLLNIALVDIGAGTSDIAISSNESISAYGMVPMAGDEVTETIVQEFLVDFNTAEKIKRSINNQEEIEYIDVLGMENTITSEEAEKVISSIVKKESDEICKKILELNGNKSPSAIFLVGGGAHTPGMLENIAENLNLSPKRIAIKDRNAVTECISDNDMGSAGVTVLGIALTAIRSLGNDFIDVTLNDEIISLFNSHKHTVMDVLVQGGVNPSLLISKNGKSVRFTYNGCKRIVFGECAVSAKIKLNDAEAGLESEVEANDKVEITYAQNGKDAKPKLYEHIKDINSISMYIDDELINLEPIILVNGENKDINYEIQNGDEIKVFLPKTIKEIKQYIIKENIDLGNKEFKLNDEYEVSEGEKIYKYTNDDENIVELIAADIEDTISEEEKIEETSSEEIEIFDTKEEESISDEKADKVNKYEESFEEVAVIVNGEEVCMSGKERYVIVDIFNYIDFDLTVPKGVINLTINGRNSSYTESVKNGDVIEVFWSREKIN